ncbi:hypothetical protein B7P43_G03886 [Cryptotermes secundus]|uniref:Endonuclease/exonuclease/phosphatase domain-containing protein n=1 Tax=Cryptotermes secundus TaxID=105785 RepID=A0A2J7RAQ5_9NEOP|nr:hypothetical protein B7P43_G03886 [Cryptotermes secundus]
MAKFLRIAQWNASGVPSHQEDIKIFLNINSIDILLISETHFTSRSYFNIPKYKLYRTNHPDDTTHGGTAILIKEIACLTRQDSSTWKPVRNKRKPFLWGHLKAQDYANKPRTIESLKANISEAIQEVTPDVRARTFQNVTRRVQCYLDANCGHFQHLL